MRIALLLLAVLLAAGCGQKGALYLRQNPPPGVKPPREEPYTPVPYPPESSKRDGEDDAAAKK
ncbi:MAG TPA: lipoprotein [Burkholderiales bacterium]|nr:lipoprotein [Burkholderiales bacterium]